jgi:quercetin dioxygenase-like cupin family protein
MKLHHVLVASALFATGPLAAHVASAQQVGTHRTELQRHDLSTPGLEVIQLRVDLDPGTVAPRHRHPGKEIIYVPAGTWFRNHFQAPTRSAAGGY